MLGLDTGVNNPEQGRTTPERCAALRLAAILDWTRWHFDGECHVGPFEGCSAAPHGGQ